MLIVLLSTVLSFTSNTYSQEVVVYPTNLLDGLQVNAEQCRAITKQVNDSLPIGIDEYNEFYLCVSK